MRDQLYACSPSICQNDLFPQEETRHYCAGLGFLRICFEWAPHALPKLAADDSCAFVARLPVHHHRLQHDPIDRYLQKRHAQRKRGHVARLLGGTLFRAAFKGSHKENHTPCFFYFFFCWGPFIRHTHVFPEDPRGLKAMPSTSTPHGPNPKKSFRASSEAGDVQNDDAFQGARNVHLADGGGSKIVGNPKAIGVLLGWK